MKGKRWQVHTTTGFNGPDVCYVSREEEESETFSKPSYASFLQAYQAAVPPEALVPSHSNAWHVKMLHAVEAQQPKLSAGEGQLVCRNETSLTCIYIYAEHV